MNPIRQQTENNSNRLSVIKDYDKEWWEKVAEYGSDDDMRLASIWRKYLGPYASATLKDLNMEDTVLGRTYVEDYFYKNDDELNGKWLQKLYDDIWETAKRERGYKEQSKDGD